jgi:hypothetical protein
MFGTLGSELRNEVRSGTAQVIRVPIRLATAVRISVPSSSRSISHIRANSVESEGNSTISSAMYSDWLFIILS